MDQSRATVDAKHVLLVLDDDPAVRDSLNFSLGIEGFDVRVYASPKEFLNDNSLPAFGSCLIVDYHMPEMNGLDVIANTNSISERVDYIGEGGDGADELWIALDV
jgi:FixJ family two-component response regulator